MSDKDKKAKLKQERKEIRRAKKIERKKLFEESIDQNPLKFKEWFSLKGIRKEIKNVNWLKGKALIKDSAIVLVFTLLLGLFFYGSDAIIALILRALGMN